ncbi:MAG TPA: hypothetical protein VNV36_05235 [Pseudomonas sp.]|uniref:hypothetical protein n=1 Tax=Pseudomonas sp. TaxID=306 RepID=UPI002C8D371C|nr:hypothetical protein [Pseudomonas sp.]HWH86165.1 hypothetical protein [Pseudomonas sp.]
MSRAQIIGGEKLQKALKELMATKAAHVRAGVLEGATYPDGTKVATVAADNEFGSPTNPPRSYMRRTVVERSGVWKDGFAKLMQSNTPEVALEILGKQMVKDIQQTIKAIGAEGGNSKETIERKGFDKPLTDSGHLGRSIDSEVVPGESE